MRQCVALNGMSQSGEVWVVVMYTGVMYTGVMYTGHCGLACSSQRYRVFQADGLKTRQEAGGF